MKTVRMMMAFLVALLVQTAFCDDDAPVLENVSLKGRIDERNIEFTLKFDVTVKKWHTRLPLVEGGVVLKEIPTLPKRVTLEYVPADRTYYLNFRYRGSHSFEFKFAAKPDQQKGGWQHTAFTVPASQKRNLEITSARKDLEVLFPNALRVKRDPKADELKVTALLGADKPFAVKWKPQVVEMKADLVFSTSANTIVTAAAGALRMDTVYSFGISQGKLKEIRMTVPKGLNVIQVKGQFIRDWKLNKGEKEGELHVILNRELDKDYLLHVVSESLLGRFPQVAAVAVISPKGAIRSDGMLMLGSNSLIKMTVKESSGVSRIDAEAFSAIQLEPKKPRMMPRNRLYHYMFATSPYALTLELADVFPSYDVKQRLVMRVREEDLLLTAGLELEVRDTGIRSLEVLYDGDLEVSSVKHAQLDDYFSEVLDDGEKRLTVNFKRPIIGNSLLELRLGLGQSPLRKPFEMAPLKVVSARKQRGYLTVASDTGIKLKINASDELRKVHVTSVPMRVVNAVAAYRFRDVDWNISLTASKDQASIIAESFHLVSLGEGIAYGNMVVNYIISGAPVDELFFRIPETLKNVEFIGCDVRRWEKTGDEWMVKLQQPVSGEYNVGISFTQPCGAGSQLLLGGPECRRVESHRGYIVLAGSTNFKLGDAADADRNVLAIDSDEIPPGYRLLVNAPILKAYKFIDSPHSLKHAIGSYPAKSTLPLLVEVSSLATDVNVDDNGNAQTVTRVRYKIKNLSGQFLTLSVPEDSSYLKCRKILTNQGQETVVDLRARLNEEKDILMVPVDRHHNPNEPLTVELEYGQPQKKLAWNDALTLKGPMTYSTSTFVNWRVKVFGERCIFPSGAQADMRTANRLGSERGVILLIRRLASLWSQGAKRWFNHVGAILLAILAGIATVAAIIMRRRKAVAFVIVAFVAASLTWIGALGVAAIRAQSLRPDLTPMKTLSFTKAANLSGESLQVAVRILPDWCCFIQFPAAPIVAGVVILALALALIKPKLRLVGGLVAVAGAIWVAAQFPHAEIPLLHLLTWVFPAIVLLLAVARFCRAGVGAIRLKPATAILPLVLAAACVTNTVSAKTVEVAVPTPILGNLKVDLMAEKDSVQATMRFAFKVEDEPMEVPLIGSDAILMGHTVTKGDADEIEMIVRDGMHRVMIKDDGEYELEVKLLAPRGGQALQWFGEFKAKMPHALTNVVTLTVPKTGLKIGSPSAVSLTTTETKTATTAVASFIPGAPMEFAWMPRVRQLKKEKAVFFVEGDHLVRFATGTTRGRHLFKLQIAQGELNELALEIPKNMTVTSVVTQAVGAWRFDAETHMLEIRFEKPQSGECAVSIKTQLSTKRPPFTVEIAVPRVLKAENQRATLGVSTDATVTLQSKDDLQQLNPEDYTDTPTSILMQSKTAGELKKLFRITDVKTVAKIGVMAVIPELRSQEQSVFSVGDERLVYNSVINLEVTKAGIYTVNLSIPKGYDIDALNSKDISHWDDETTKDGRQITVHFKNKFIGSTALVICYSRPIESLPGEIVVPNATVTSSLRHGGMLELVSDRAIRLIPNKPASSGVSDVTGDVYRRQIKSGSMTYKILRKNWTLTVNTKVVVPRVNVEYLHHARVNDASVRHACSLRFTVQNAGTKVFRVKVPENAIGVQINGPNLARKTQEKGAPSIWRIELNRKYLEAPYPLNLSFETRVDRKSGQVAIAPVRVLDCDLQRGYVAISSESRVELELGEVSESLQLTDPRQVPSKFGRIDVSKAVYCFRDLSGSFDLQLKARRHNSADQLNAEVLSVDLKTVITVNGGSVNHLKMRLRVNDRRHLKATLPPLAEIWSLAVNKTAVPITTAESDNRVILIPLQFGASATSEVVDVELSYVIKDTAGWQGVKQSYDGPAFDLPLKNVIWDLFLPEQFDYDDFDGNMTSTRQNEKPPTLVYDLRSYEERVRQESGVSLKMAEDFQRRGAELAKTGRPVEARHAFRNAFTYSQSDLNFNEDARVQLNSLIRKQAIVGLVDQRDNLNWEFRQKGKRRPSGELNFSFDEAERIQNSLNKRDSENLEMIADRIINGQEAARGNNGQLQVSLPICGKHLRFKRALQVEPDTPMLVSFQADPKVMSKQHWEILFCIVIGLVVTAVLAGINHLPRDLGEIAETPIVADAAVAAEPTDGLIESDAKSEVSDDTDNSGDVEVSEPCADESEEASEGDDVETDDKLTADSAEEAETPPPDEEATGETDQETPQETPQETVADMDETGDSQDFDESDDVKNKEIE